MARGGDEAVTGTGKACPAVEKKYYIFREKGGVHPASNVTDESPASFLSAKLLSPPGAWMNDVSVAAYAALLDQKVRVCAG